MFYSALTLKLIFLAKQGKYNFKCFEYLYALSLVMNVFSQKRVSGKIVEQTINSEVTNGKVAN